MTLDEELKEIEERVAGHTPGPWQLTPTHIGPIECHDMGMGWETYSAFKDEDIEIARSAPDILRIATEYRERLAEAVGLIEDLCNEWGMWYVAQEFRARLEGENNG